MEVPAPIPTNLINHPCKVVGPGKTYGSLKRAYTANTTCVGKYEGVINGINNYNLSISPETVGKDEGHDKK